MRLRVALPGLLAALLLAPVLAAAEDEGASPPPAAPAAEPPLVFLRVNAKGAEEWWRRRDGAVVVRVPGGPFRRRPYEGIVATAEPRDFDVPSFLMDRDEVTNTRFAAFLRETESAEGLVREGVRGIVRDADGWAAEPGWEDHPVTAATGAGALAYAKWVGGRIPKAPEWEKAAGGPDGLVYPWGDETPDERLANFGRPSLRGTERVGSHPLGASPYGCLDMAGNAYDRVLTTNRSGDHLPVMLKGGSWVSTHPLNLRVLDLCMQPMGGAEGSVGFRCAMDDPEPDRPTRTAAAPAHVPWETDFDAAVARARKERKPIFLSLQLDTCGQCDRTRAQLFRDPAFVKACAEKLVCVAGHVSGDALDDPHPAGEGGACPLYPGLTCAQHEDLYARGLAVVPTLAVSPGMFLLDPDLVAAGRKRESILVGESRIAKWGNDVAGALEQVDAACASLAGKPADGDGGGK